MKLLIVGAGGAMGQRVAALAKEQQTEVLAGIDPKPFETFFPIFDGFEKLTETPDVLIDFSTASALDGVLSYAVSNKIPCVLATTGYSAEQIEKIKNAARKIPIFFTANFSLGVNLLSALARIAVRVLGNDFDVEIVEKHHRKKVDAPSGTALMLADTVNDEMEQTMHYEYDRHSKRAARTQTEIGIHSVRGGTIVGEHDIIFAGNDEVLTLSHAAGSKNVFAAGALKAANFISGQDAGLYDMNDLVRICP